MPQCMSYCKEIGHEKQLYGNIWIFYSNIQILDSVQQTFQITFAVPSELYEIPVGTCQASRLVPTEHMGICPHCSWCDVVGKHS